MSTISPTVSSPALSDTTINVEEPCRLIYASSDSLSKKKDFTQGLCCILQGYSKGLEDGKGKRFFDCVDVSQIHASFVYEKNEKVVSRFIRLRYTGEEDIFGEADISIYIPYCMSRSSALHREAAVKVKLNNTWIYLDTEESSAEEFKDVRLVHARFTGGVPSFVCVVTRYKRDIIKFAKRSTRNSSSVDQRFSIKSETGCFTGRPSFIMQIQPVDTNTVSRLQSSVPDGRVLLCSSNIINIAWGSEKFKKTVTVNLPMPANPVKMKRLAKVEAAAKADTEKKRRHDTKKDDKVNKWYLGIYGEDENDTLFLFHFDMSSETWIHLPDVSLVEIRKDLLSFQMTKPLHKFVVLRCRKEATPADAKKLVYLIEEELSLRAVKFILFQNPREHSEVTVHCVSVQKADALYDELYDLGWRFHATNGPPISKQVMLKEGSVFEIGFRGNIKFDERFHPGSKRVLKYYNSEMPCQITFAITETDKHLQKNYDFYKGVCMVYQLDRLTLAFDSHQPSIAVSNTVKSSTGSLHSHATKKASSNIVTDKRKMLAELMLQLAKGIDSGPHTPPAGKLSLALDPLVVEAIDAVAIKLGKEWEVLAHNLGLSRGRIEAIKTRNKHQIDQMKQDMLYTWVKRQPRSADQLPKLYHSLMSCGRIDLAYKVEDLYCAEPEPLVVEITPPEDLPIGSMIDLMAGVGNVNNNNALTALRSPMPLGNDVDAAAVKRSVEENNHVGTTSKSVLCTTVHC